MRKEIEFTHQFVEFIPDDLKEGVIYVSVRFATASHKCCCGCGNKVITPISPTDWKLTFDGKSVSLSPSIGNWGFPCQSHYWITNNKVHWAARWSKGRIEAGRTHDDVVKERYFGPLDADAEDFLNCDAPGKTGKKEPPWHKLKSWWRGKNQV